MVREVPDPRPHHLAHPRLRSRGAVLRRLVAGLVGVAGLPWALLLGAVLTLGHWSALGEDGRGGVTRGGAALLVLAILSSVFAAATGVGYALDPRPGLQRALLASGALAAAPLAYALVRALS